MPTLQSLTSLVETLNRKGLGPDVPVPTTRTHTHNRQEWSILCGVGDGPVWVGMPAPLYRMDQDRNGAMPAAFAVLLMHSGAPLSLLISPSYASLLTFCGAPPFLCVLALRDPICPTPKP